MPTNHKMEDLRYIIQEFKKIRDEESLNSLTDDCLFDCATRVFNSQNIQRDSKEAKPKESMYSNPKLPITEKQVNMLLRLGYKGDVKVLSRQEARTLIKEMLNRLKPIEEVTF